MQHIWIVHQYRSIGNETFELEMDRGYCCQEMDELCQVRDEQGFVLSVNRGGSKPGQLGLRLRGCEDNIRFCPFCGMGVRLVVEKREKGG